MPEEKNTKNFFENTYVKASTFIALIMFIIGATYEVTVFRESVSHEIRQMRQSIERLEKTVMSERLSKSEMEKWVLETEKMNPGWEGAEVRK